MTVPPSEAVTGPWGPVAHEGGRIGCGTRFMAG